MTNVFLTVDLGFGDAGKGSIVDFLTRSRDAHTVVRYNGGPQAAHRVVTAAPTAQEHVFSQWGSGTLARAATHLSQFMLVDPLAMVMEAEHLQTLGVRLPFDLVTIDERALIITPFHRAANRLRELARGNGRHGSCGMGVGEAMSDYLEHGSLVLQARDLLRRDVLVHKLRFLQRVGQSKIEPLLALLPDTAQTDQELDILAADDTVDWLSDAYHDFGASAKIVGPGHLRSLLQRRGTVIFEGAQGVLLDEWHGFHPFTTWSTTTLTNADTLLADAGFGGTTMRLGLTRAYATRHGPGPLVTEDAALSALLPDACNNAGAWQGDFRVGWLDLVLLRYALDVVGALDGLAVTCLDRLGELPELRLCDRYSYDSFSVDRLLSSPAPHSLPYQAQLTANLAQCSPVLETVPDVRALLERVTRGLGLPVRIVSHGATADDKHFHHD